MVDYADLSRRQMIKGVSVWLKRIDPDEDVLLTDHQVRGILDILAYVFRLEAKYHKNVWPNLRKLLSVVAPKLEWAGYREDGWIQYLEQGIEFAHTLGDEQTVGILSIELGRQHEQLGDFECAEQVLLNCLEIFENEINNRYKVHILAQLAYVTNLQEKFYESQLWLDKALSTDTSNLKEQAYLYFVQAIIQLAKEEYNHTIYLLQHALSIRNIYGTKREIAIILNNLGAVYYLQKRYEPALNYLNQALKIYQDIQSPIQQSQTQMNIGCIYIDTNRVEEGLSLFQVIEPQFHNSKDKYQLALLSNNQGWAYYISGRLHEAEQMYNVSIMQWECLDILYQLTNSLDNLGLVYLQQKCKEKAIFQFKLCLQKLRGVENTPEYHNMYNEIIEHLHQAECLPQRMKIGQDLLC